MFKKVLASFLCTVLILTILPATTSKADTVPTVSVQYKSHIQNIGWQDYSSDGALSGTIGQSLRLEAINIKVENDSNLGIKYTSHVQDVGWQNYVADDALSGTSGQSKRLEAIKINLTGQDADLYDVYYRVHVQNYGWLSWAKDGQAAGSEGLSKRVEAIEIVIVKKTDSVNYDTTNPFVSIYGNGQIPYRTHVQNYGWQGYVSDGTMSGTQGQALRLEAINIHLNTNLPSGSVVYSTHVQDYGWMAQVSDGALSGTTGQSKRLEAIKINLTGDIGNQYDIYYCVQVQSIGWMGWVKDGAMAGTQGRSLRLEAIEIKLVLKEGWQTIDGKIYYYDSTGSKATGYQTINGLKYYFDTYGVLSSKVGIDVSKYQGSIDWNAVKATGVNFAMIRLGFRGYGSDGTLVLDPYYLQNIKNATAAGIQVGVYFYSQAITSQEAIEEADMVLSNISGYNVSYPIAFDTEYVSTDTGRANNLSAADRTTIAIAFCNTIRNAGYTPMIYSNKNFLLGYLDLSRLSSDKIWVANYNNTNDYPNSYQMWQYTSSGSVSGINGNVDLDIALNNIIN
jgi:uncharacterized protein YjdB/GH25 family lysozyme M1 (1,4-beta-N-acetylmuramidase)